MVTAVHQLVRNQEIHRLRKEGASYVALSKKYGITQPRVRQIYERIEQREEWFRSIGRQQQFQEILSPINEVLDHPWGYWFLKHYEEFRDKAKL